MKTPPERSRFTRFAKIRQRQVAVVHKGGSVFSNIFSGISIRMFYYVCIAILRATGDTKRPMHFLIIGGIVKVAFAVLFTSVFDMNVAGAAVSTIISAVSESYLFVFGPANRLDVIFYYLAYCLFSFIIKITVGNIK